MYVHTARERERGAKRNHRYTVTFRKDMQHTPPRKKESENTVEGPSAEKAAQEVEAKGVRDWDIPGTPSTAKKASTRIVEQFSLQYYEMGFTAGRLGNVVKGKVMAIEEFQQLFVQEPLVVSSTGLVKVVRKPHDGGEVELPKDLALVAEGLHDTKMMLVLPKGSCVGAVAAMWSATVKLYEGIYSIVEQEADEALRNRLLEKMGNIAEYDSARIRTITFANSVDRHERTLKECKDACALGFGAKALQIAEIVRGVEAMLIYS